MPVVFFPIRPLYSSQNKFIQLHENIHTTANLHYMQLQPLIKFVSSQERVSILTFPIWPRARVVWRARGTSRKTAEDGHGNIGKTIRLITQDKKHKWMSEIKQTFVPSCSQLRLQLLHFHAVFNTWPTFQGLMSIFMSGKRRWSQKNFSENRQIKHMLKKDMRIMKKCFSCLPTLVLPSSFALGP